MDKEPMAVVSDVHGNVRALDAVLAEISRRGIRRVVNLGDCVYEPFDARRQLRSGRAANARSGFSRQERKGWQGHCSVARVQV